MKHRRRPGYDEIGSTLMPSLSWLIPRDGVEHDCGLTCPCGPTVEHVRDGLHVMKAEIVHHRLQKE